MRIKRFVASDMRTALRLVREEHGPDAVILSNRATPEGVEVVAATDYDEALVQQALRSMGAQGADAAVAAVVAVAVQAPAAAPAAPATPAMAFAAAVAEPAPVLGRAVFDLGPEAPAPGFDEILRRVDADPAVVVAPPRKPSRLEQMMAALTPAAPARIAVPQPRTAAEAMAQALAADAAPTPVMPDPFRGPQVADVAPAGNVVPAAQVPQAELAPEPAQFAEVAQLPTPAQPANVDVAAPAVTTATDADTDATDAGRTPLRLVAPEAADPAVSALRDELAAMRQVIERELGQFAVERLRGSKARAAAIDHLVACGCEPALAQAVAARIDAGLDPADIQAPMLAELARLLPVRGDDLIESGGVIALVGPTGAGKTTTIAKLAARYASRHRARDVALVSADGERVGAREQLHALGRRLGVTVCDADGPEGLSRALEQLSDYPLVLIDTAGFANRDRALLSQILWLRSAEGVRSLLVLPANAHPQDLAETVRRYRPAAPEGVVLTKLDETSRSGAALGVLVHHGLSLAYTTAGQQVPEDLEVADATRLVRALESSPGAAVNPLVVEDRHACA